MGISHARSYWAIVLAAAAVLTITMGVRQSIGLFVSPINTTTGLGIATISLSLAVGQFVWGAIQPIAGAVADRYGPGRVIVAGTILLALGFACAPWMTSAAGLGVTLGLMMAAGAGAGSFSVLIGAAAQRIPPERRGMAAGVINAGGSFGQAVFAPLAQKLIAAFGWMNAMWAMACMVLAALPLASALRGAPKPAGAAGEGGGLKAAVGTAFRDRSYLLLHAGFFTCGFHIAFLVTHLPGEVALCGLPPQVASWSLALIGIANIAGSLFAGWGLGRWRGKMILFAMYGSRALLIAVYLAAPKTATTFYLFAVGLGFTWLATVPPTAGVVGKLFGVRYLATLFGLTLLSHQIGGFFGAWLGGLALENAGSYQLMWYADIVLAALAALANLPIREPKVAPAGA